MGQPDKIIVMTNKYSVVVKGIEKKLVESGYDVSAMEYDEQAYGAVIEGAVLCVIYLPPDDITEKIQHNISLIVENLKQNHCRIILIGEALHHDDVIEALPTLDGYPWVDRPVDVDDFAFMVDKMLKKNTDESGPKNILIVDDDPTYAKMVREWLKTTYKVSVATAGMQAITHLLKNKVDLILLDYEMPLVDGTQVFQMLRSDPETKDIPVIFLTGIGSRDRVEKAMKLRPDGYILKTTPRERLMESLNSFFSVNK